MKQINASRLTQIIKWIILLIVLILLVNYLIKHRHEFHFLTEIELEYIIPVVLLTVFVLLLSCLRFDMMLTHVAHRMPRYTVFKYFVLGRIINRFLPYGGSVYRAIMFKKSDGVSYKKYVASNVAFDWLNLFYSTLFGIVVVGVLDPRLMIRSVPLLPLFLGALVLLVTGIPLVKAILIRFGRSASSGPFKARVDEMSEIVDRFTDVLRNQKIFFANSIIISLVVGCSLVSFTLLFKSVGVDTDVAVLLVYLIILRFFSAMRITPANLGIREFLLGYLTFSLGIGAAEGVAVSIMMRLVTLCVQGFMSLGIFVLGGAGRLLSGKKGWGRNENI
jgi:uncharacterized protein (TIRG00374 family)